MCSPPSETTCSKGNKARDENIISAPSNLQSNQQDLYPNIASIVNLDFISLDTVTATTATETDSFAMPFPPASRSRAPPQELPSKAYSYNNKKGDALTFSSPNRFATARLPTSTSSTSHDHLSNNLGAYRAVSPNSTDIWADPSAAAAISPSSPLDYLRDIDLTPCTTFSTLPSRTPSEEDNIEDTWRHHNKLLEIPDLENPMQSLLHSPTAITSEPTNPYYRKVTGAVRRDIRVPFDQHRPLPSRPAPATSADRDGIQPRRDPIPGPDKTKFHIPGGSGVHVHAQMPVQVGSNFKQAIQLNRGDVRQAPPEYYDRSHQVYGVPHANMQGQYYYNQQQQQHLQQQQQQHHKVPHPQHQQQVQQQSHHFRSAYGHEPRSPPSYKLQVHAQSWAPSPHHNTPTGTKNVHRVTTPTPLTPKQSHGQQQRTHQHGAVTISTSSPAGGSRPTYEILKTLLRKKACLYEPGTSRAIALITWLEGRKLALLHGYFSRQHLQSGVHAVVAEKIDSGMITRTKVNRCMQIILNSCFHYIIPRPDGTEENGDLFKEAFARNVVDDTHLLKTLSQPWDDLEVRDEFLLDHELDEKDDSEKHGDDKSESKRVVLLCFNENVRSAEDVLRCHNDFIRDAAITGKLSLTAEEWQQFFSLKDDDDSKSDSRSVVPASPKLKAKGGCDIPYLTFDIPPEVSSSLNFKHEVHEPWSRCVDTLGQMNNSELNKFRTTWCCKRYDHEHALCRFAHVDVNEGWLRRDPSVYEYCDKMCVHTTIIKSPTSPLDHCYLNTCPDGLNCKFAHSHEEIDYHPRCYKSTICDAVKPSSMNCKLRDVCPKSHPDNPRSPSHSKSLRNNFGKRTNEATARKGGQHGNSKHATQGTPSSTVGNNAPMAAPIIYHKPAPPSEFEKTILFPGLQSLYRRNCAMVYANFLGKKDALQKYSNFGDNWEDEDADDLIKNNEAGNNCFSLYSSIGGK